MNNVAGEDEPPITVEEAPNPDDAEELAQEPEQEEHGDETQEQDVIEENVRTEEILQEGMTNTEGQNEGHRNEGASAEAEGSPSGTHAPNNMAAGNAVGLPEAATEGIGFPTQAPNMTVINEGRGIPVANQDDDVFPRPQNRVPGFQTTTTQAESTSAASPGMGTARGHSNAQDALADALRANAEEIALARAARTNRLHHPERPGLDEFGVFRSPTEATRTTVQVETVEDPPTPPQ
jgi:hypothetical protein